MIVNRLIVESRVFNAYFNTFKERFCLTPREIEVLSLLIVCGNNNRELGEQLHITEKTLNNHITKIKFKTRTHSIRELQAFIYRDSFNLLLVNIFKNEENMSEPFYFQR
ncbi:helix-turn-helix transcriptional regulator [Paenibacillus qinlingensis]|uniref:DNA-binding CsgD family transcriptional regulator n=1 Tax=Paenibacillus qinlingensis TaxID=1837343 RepID=A0ABU1NPY4_9BACL|nr:helix-turn-helix transcriptional regulator [Paenibacillus qinlingensis]MDR6549077.1 DNA-binding CsgD family transcriptional regulator [Paenibacillus qinlingensis]